MAGRRIALAVVVLAVVGGCASKTPRGEVATESSVVASVSAPVSASVSPTAASAQPLPGATSAALIHDHWSALPPAPIAGRTQMASAWTGHQFIVWGGATGSNRDQLLADGAAYDTATGKWTTLPAAPISARSSMASVWTGSELFIWGGYTQLADNAQRATADGAMYDPAAKSWRKLPPAPLSPRVFAQAFWLDGKVIVLGGQPAVTSASQYSNVDLAMFDPATNRWSKAIAMPTNNGQSWVAITAAATDDRVIVWREWAHWVDNGDSSTGTTWGIEPLVFDLATSTWIAGPAQSPSAPAGFTAAVWTGSAIYVPDNDYWCGGCAGPLRPGGPGHLLEARTNTWTTMPAGPVDSLRPSALWTGSALLAYNTSTEMSGPDGVRQPGEAAVWDPAANAWSALPPAPLYGSDIAAAWAGDQLLEWGDLFVPTDPGASTAPSAQTGGLRFGP